MKPWYISIPHEVNLKDQSEWVSNGEYRYFVYRNHWFVKPRQVGLPVQGDIITAFKAEAAPGRVFEGSYETEWGLTETEESIKQVLIEEELKAGISSELLAS